MVTRALRVGEGRKFKGYEKRAEAINRIEPEMELLDDAELRQEADDLRKRAAEGESLDDLLPEAFALTPSPASVLRKTARVAVSVLPSPVFISAIAPSCRTMPPISCTS